VADAEDVLGSPISCRTASHLKLNFIQMEVENKAKLSPMLL